MNDLPEPKYKLGDTLRIGATEKELTKFGVIVGTVNPGDRVTVIEIHYNHNHDGWAYKCDTMPNAVKNSRWWYMETMLSKLCIVENFYEKG